MKKLRKVFALLLTTCMVLGCMTVSAFAASAVTTSAFGQSTYPTVSGNYADTVYAKASVDVGKTVTDSGELVLYSNYGLCTVTDWNYAGAPTVSSNNTSVATAAITYSGSTLNVAITGVANGTATITVNYGGQTTVNSNQIHSGTKGAAIGNIKYTVTVGTGTSDSSGSGSTAPGGSGESGKPNALGWIKITTVDELLAVANDMTAKYYLGNDIDLSAYENGTSWTPLGWTSSDDVPFTGIFDGRGHTISGYDCIWGGTNLGLFAINNGTIRNLYLEFDEVEGNSSVGALCGENNGTIDFVHVSGRTVGALNSSGAAPVGALVGKNGTNGEITRCSASANNVYGYNYAGGLVGHNYGLVSASKSNTSVNNDMTTSSKSRYYAGGLIGGNVGTVQDCYSHSNTVSGKQKVGGFAGFNGSTGEIINSYANTSLGVVGSSEVNGDIGKNSGSVSNSYCSNNPAVFTSISSWTSIQNGLDNTRGNWALDTSNPVLLTWEVNGYGDLEEVEPPASTNYTVTFAAGDVRQGDNVTLPTPNPITVTVASGETGSVTLEQGAERTSVVNGDTWYYRFIGWTDGTTVYDLGDTVAVTGDVTLNAVWKLYTVDGNKAWTYLDAMAIMDYLAGNVEFYPEQVEVADYDSDGKITYLDAMTIMDVLAGIKS